MMSARAPYRHRDDFSQAAPSDREANLHRGIDFLFPHLRLVHEVEADRCDRGLRAERLACDGELCHVRRQGGGAEHLQHVRRLKLLRCLGKNNRSALGPAHGKKTLHASAPPNAGVFVRPEQRGNRRPKSVPFAAGRRSPHVCTRGALTAAFARCGRSGSPRRVTEWNGGGHRIVTGVDEPWRTRLR